jgi:hypothetical protein
MVIIRNQKEKSEVRNSHEWLLNHLGILRLNSCIHPVNNVGFVPQIRGMDGKLTADITKTYLLSGPRHPFQCRNDDPFRVIRHRSHDTYMTLKAFGTADEV